MLPLMCKSLLTLGPRASVKVILTLCERRVTGNLDEVRILIRLGASTDVTCNAGWTPLHEACAYDHVDVVSIVCEIYTLDGSDWCGYGSHTTKK